MRRPILVVVSLLALQVLLAGHALAGDKDEAKRLFESGLKLMKSDDFTAAAANFERSSTLYPSQNSLFNLANCYKAMQRYGEALDVLKRLRQEFGDKLKPDIKEAAAQQETEIQSVVATLVLTVEPATAKVSIDGRLSPSKSAAGTTLLAPGDHTIEASLEGYRSLRRTVHLVSGAHTSERIVLDIEPGYLVVRSDPSGAAVWVDGVEKAKTPVDPALALGPGNHLITLRIAGYKETERNLEIHAGERQVLELTLAAFEPGAPAPVVAPVAETTTNLSTTPAETAPSKSRTWRTVAWTSGAGAVAAGAVAIVFKVLGDRQFEDAKKHNNDYGDHGDPKDDVGAHSAMSNAQRDGYVAIGCGVGGGLLAATAVVGFILDRRAQNPETASSVSVSATGLRLGF
jgi:hypothetical protein